jgi:hypothetical protein
MVCTMHGAKGVSVQPAGAVPSANAVFEVACQCQWWLACAVCRCSACMTYGMAFWELRAQSKEQIKIKTEIETAHRHPPTHPHPPPPHHHPPPPSTQGAGGPKKKANFGTCKTSGSTGESQAAKASHVLLLEYNKTNTRELPLPRARKQLAPRPAARGDAAARHPLLPALVVASHFKGTN